MKKSEWHTVDPRPLGTGEDSHFSLLTSQLGSGGITKVLYNFNPAEYLNCMLLKLILYYYIYSIPTGLPFTWKHICLHDITQYYITNLTSSTQSMSHFAYRVLLFLICEPLHIFRLWYFFILYYYILFIVFFFLPK